MVRTITQEPIDRTNDVASPAPQTPTAPGWPQSVPAESQPLEADLPPPPVCGRTLALWLDDEDCAILNKMLALARSQGLEPSDALAVRALLRVGLQHPGAGVVNQMRALLNREDHELQHQKQGPRVRQL